MPKMDMSPVAQQRVWEEHLVKVASQQRKQNAHAEFSVNPLRMKSKTMTEPKINKRELRFLDRERAALEAIQRQLKQRAEASDRPAAAADPPSEATTQRGTAPPLPPIRGSSKPPAGDDALESLMASAHAPPTKKYKFPQTEAQELGWMTSPLVKRDPLFAHGLRSCDVTRFSTFAVKK